MRAEPQGRQAWSVASASSFERRQFHTAVPADGQDGTGRLGQGCSLGLEVGGQGCVMGDATVAVAVGRDYFYFPYRRFEYFRRQQRQCRHPAGRADARGVRAPCRWGTEWINMGRGY